MSRHLRAGLSELTRIEHGLPVTDLCRTFPTGIMPLDHFIGGGLREGEVSVIGAPSGHGKSALAESIALNVSRTARTTYFALEMGQARTTLRMLSKLTGYDLLTLQNLLAKEQSHPRVVEMLRELANKRDLLVEERDNFERFEFNHLASAWIDNRAEFVIIDHPRHLDDWFGSSGQRTDLASAAIVRRIVAGAKQTSAHVMIVAQTAKKLFGKRPSMADLADTHVLAQAADLVVMVHRPFRGMGVADTVAELVIDKNRNGPEGIAHQRWHGPTLRYTDLMPAEEAELECCKPRKKSTTDGESRSEAPDSDETHWYF